MARVMVSYQLGWIAKLRELRKPMTPAEAALWKELRGRKVMGYRFERQRMLDRYVASFYCAEVALAVEVDGPIGDDVPIHRYERERDVRLRLSGVAVLRFSEEEVLHNIDGVLTSIRQCLRCLPWRRSAG